MEEDPEVVAKRRRRNQVIAVAIGVALLSVVIGAVVLNRIADARYQKTLKAETARLDEIGAILQAGRDQARVNQWDEATTKFQDAQLRLAEPPSFTLEPSQLRQADFETTIKAYLDKGGEGRKAEQDLGAARQAISDKKPGAALEVLKGITALFASKEVDALRAQAKKLITEETIAARGLRDATKDQAKMDELLSIVNDLLLNAPTNPELLQLKAIASKPIVEQGPAAVFRAGPSAPARARYKSGDVAGAKQLAEACAPKSPECKKLLEQLQDVHGKFGQVESMGVNELRALWELDIALGGGQPTDNARAARIRFVLLLYKEAVKFKSSANWAQAVKLCREALAIEPTHAPCDGLVKEAQSECKNVYLTGYEIKQHDPDDSVKYFKQVIEMCSADNPYVAKAKDRLQELGR